MNKREIDREIKKWDNRVIFDAKFGDNIKPYLPTLDNILKRSLDKFTMIAANSEALVYKIGRYFIEQGVKNDEFTFIDGKIIESYIGDDSKEWKKKDRVDEFFLTFGEDFKIPQKLYRIGELKHIKQTITFSM